MKAGWKIAALAAGLALFGWYLAEADLGTVAREIAGMGWAAPLVLIPYFVVYISDCIGWRFTLPRAPRVRFWRLFRIRWAGESVNNLVPSGYVGGEAVKVCLLQRHGVGAQAGAVSAVVSKTAQSTAQFLFILLGAVLFYRLAGGQPGLRTGLLMIIGCGVGALGVLFWVQRVGLFGLFLRIVSLCRVRLEALEKRRGSIMEADRLIFGFYRENPRRFYASAAFYMGGWMLDSVEIFLVAWMLDMPITWAQAVAMEAFTGVAKALGMWVPGSIGVQESGILLLGRLAGLPDALSATYALIRRARELIFAGAGMLLLYAAQGSFGKVKAGMPSAAR